MKVRRVDFSADEWIVEAIQQRHLTVEVGDGFGDYVLTATEWNALRREVLLRDDEVCRYCGAHADTVDHVFPKAQGGLTVKRNLVAACRSCNSRKGARL